MDITGKITGITYKVSLAETLKAIDIKDFNINESAVFCLLKDNNSSFAVSKWVSPKRTCSYPYERVYPLKLFKEENTKVLVSILVDVAFKNPRTYPVITAILSKILSLEVNNEVVTEILKSIEKRFDKIPNVGHLQVWLQRLTIKTDRNKNYTEKLCKKVIDKDTEIWNISWLNNQTIKDVFTNNAIINEDKIGEMQQIIEPNEIKVFGY